ncbi:hypothetical protein RGQ21_02370 [Kitasatospora aureofaciens]|nr:hypothetical protein RGQ21_02370 [Kitasatospora aureofaciens]
MSASAAICWSCRSPPSAASWHGSAVAIAVGQDVQRRRSGGSVDGAVGEDRHGVLTREGGEEVLERFPDRVFAFDEFAPLGTRPTAGAGWAPASR